MKSAVCTLFGGKYHHYGLGALANSLYVHGFRGTIYAGYDGPLPPWAKNVQKRDGYADFIAAEGLVIRFIPLQPKVHFACYKPYFMQQLWEQHCPDAEAMFYFDPDITVSCSWKFFEEWVEAGVALCHNTGAWCTATHPTRYVWRRFMARENLDCNKLLDEYFNAGFIGLRDVDRDFVKLWAEIIGKLDAAGLIDASKFFTTIPVSPLTTVSDITNYAFYANDQDALNIAAMSSPISLSSIGEEAMGFTYGGRGNVMLHALGSPKPWRKHYTKSALKGLKPTWSEKAYWNYTKTPMSLYSPTQRLIKMIDLYCGKILGRFL